MELDRGREKGYNDQIQFRSNNVVRGIDEKNDK